MRQEQSSLQQTKAAGAFWQDVRTKRILSSFLIGLVATILLSLLTILLLVSFTRLPDIIAQSPLVLLIPIVELLVISGCLLLLWKPASIVLYLRNVHRVQSKYHTLYTPLTALTNIRKATSTSTAENPTISTQQEKTSILDLVQQQADHQLILGVPGAGKTTALRVYQYIAAQNPLSLALAQKKIPIYVPMKNYSLFLKKQQLEISGQALLQYLIQSDLPGMRYLRHYIPRLFEQGRLLFLCDGLNEIDSDYLSFVSEELVGLMRNSQNRFVMTCREVDYRQQPDFVQLVDEGQAVCVIIYPLQQGQINEFVERYVEKQDSRWKHTAGQILQVIDRSRLRYHCTNPMMLFTLMEIIDNLGMERGKQIDTRGRLLREYVIRLIAKEQTQTKWAQGAPEEQEVMRFLSEIASAARWAHDRNAIQLRISSSSMKIEEGARSRMNFAIIVDELQFWLDEHPARSPFENHEEDSFAVPYENVTQVLQFALSSDLIELSPDGVLSFRHELIAEYFVAEYFSAATPATPTAYALREEFLEDVGRWSEPVAIWAGLLDNPLELADCFGQLGSEHPAYVLQALTLGLVCVGVLWTPPQADADMQNEIELPLNIRESLSIAVRNKQAREQLAAIFTRCAEEGGQEVYRSLLPLITTDGVDELLTLLDKNVVPQLLLAQLQDAVDNIAYETQVKRIARVLGRFGKLVIGDASELSLPAPERSVRLRAAAINVLGGTNDAQAVEPLLARLRDVDRFIVERAINALIRLGPTFVLTRILQELENHSDGEQNSYVHQAVLFMLDRFMNEQERRRQVSFMQYQHILERLVPVLTSNYAAEPEVQQMAHELLVQQGKKIEEKSFANERDNRGEKVVDALISYLSAQSDVAVRNIMQVLQDIGPAIVPRLLERFPQLPEAARIHVIEILTAIQDTQALPLLFRLLSEAPTTMQQPVAHALRSFAPDSVSGLIDSVLHGSNDIVSDRATHILVSIGAQAVPALTEALPEVVPGRTRFLVQALAQIHDVRAVPALIQLLEHAQLEPLLVIAVVRALSKFPDKRVVLPLLNILQASNPQVYEEAITALSQLGEMVLDGLVEVLNVDMDNVVTQRAKRAILGIEPFPGQRLMRALEQASPAQAEQIMSLFKMKGRVGAIVLVQHLNHQDEKVREYVQDTLLQLPGSVTVPALLDVLNQPTLRKSVSTLLLRYPEEAIAPLVQLLGEPERGPFAMAILPQYGLRILRPLLVGLDDQRSLARESAQRILVELVRQSTGMSERDVMQEMLLLFIPTLPPRARESLLAVLTNELADNSIPVLLEGLEDARLIEDVAEAFVRMAQRPIMLNVILNALVRALYSDEKRQGAEIALIQIGHLGVTAVGDLIVDPKPEVSKSAKYILSEIGVPALSYILTAYSDRNNPERRMAARAVFRSMPPEVIKDELVSLVVSETRDDIAMAVPLLLERIHEESTMDYADQVMVPELIQYILLHDQPETNLRVLALLLLAGEAAIIDHLIQALHEEPRYQKQLAYVFLLFGPQSQSLLFDMFEDPNLSAELRAEIATILSMSTSHTLFTDLARSLSKYSLFSSNENGPLYSEELALALRTLGGLLASGHWNVRRLYELREACEDDDPSKELFNVLLGWRYEPQLALLKEDLETHKASYAKEVVAKDTLLAEQELRINNLEDELQKYQDDYTYLAEDKKRLEHEKTDLKVINANLIREKNELTNRLNILTKERGHLKRQIQEMHRQYGDTGPSTPPSNVR